METYQKFEGDEQLIWDVSSLNILLACPYKYWLARVNGWRLPSRNGNLKANWGTAWHACQDVYDTTIFNGGEKEEGLRHAIKHALTYKDYLYQNPELTKIDNSRTVPTLVRSLVGFRDKWDVEALKTVRTPEGTPSVEIRFEVPLPGTKYRISGRIDKLVEMEGLIYVVDRKTTGQALSRWYFDAYLTDNQIRTYIWALREQLGIPVAGFIIDAVQTLVNTSRFERSIFSVTKEQTDEWLRTTQYHVNEVAEYLKSGVWPQRFAACGLYGGCQFRNKICSRPEPFRQAYLESDFQIEERRVRDHTTAPNLIK